MAIFPSKLLFLPGASGNTEFWRPAAERLALPAKQIHIGWPGFGSTPPDSIVTGMADLHMPVLLLWGDADPISPIRVGQRLAELLPRAELHIIPGGHDLGFTHADEVASLIDRHLVME